MFRYHLRARNDGCFQYSHVILFALPSLAFTGPCSIMRNQCSLAETETVHKDNLLGGKKANFFPLFSLLLFFFLKQYIIFADGNVIRSSRLLS